MHPYSENVSQKDAIELKLYRVFQHLEQHGISKIETRSACSVYRVLPKARHLKCADEVEKA